MSSLMSTYRSVVGRNGKDSPKPSSGGTQRSNTSLSKVEPWLDNDSLELISNPGSSKVTRKFINPISLEDEVQVFKPAQSGLPLHITNRAFEGEESLNAVDSEGLSILHRAVLSNNIQTVRTLLDNGADINIKGKGGFTPLLAAVRFERVEIMKLLLERGADPLIPKDNEMTPLHLAARRGLIDMCIFLLKDPRVKNNLQLMNRGSITPFFLACWSGSREVCELLLRNGADIASKLASGHNPLHFVSYSGHEDVCELLIKTASERLPNLYEFLNEKDSEGFTPLHYACSGGHDRVGDLLLRHGADREAVNLVAFASPLHLAATHGHLSMVELLLLYGAVTDSRDGKLRTPLHSAAAFNHYRIVEILLESGADLEAKDALEMTPLLTSVTHGAVQAVKLLVDRGADLTATDSSLNSALHLAIMYRKPEMVKALLEIDSDRVLVQMKDKDLKTVLHLACGLETSEILEIFMEKRICIRGRDINEKNALHIAAETGSFDCTLALSKVPDFASILGIRDDNGMTALHLAASHKHTKTCELLISKGADVTSKDKSNRHTALHLAVKAGSLKTVQVLTDWLLPSTLEERDIGQNTPLHLACRYNRPDVLQQLLDKGADVTAKNNRNMTCLDVAIEWEAGEVAKTLVKHHRWEEVLQGTDCGNRPMLKLIEKLPDVAEIVLDQCVTYSPLPPSHEDYSVKFNMRHLDPDVNLDCAYFFAPAIMAKHKREKLLNHVVTQVLLRFKWMMLGKFISIFNTLVFAIFVILYSCFVVKARDRSTMLSDTKSEHINEKSTFETAAPVILSIFLISQFIKEIVQLAWMRLAYVTDLTNVLELAMYGTVWVFILPHAFRKEDLYSIRTQWNAGIVGLLLCYVSLTLHFRRFGGVGLYVTMYVEVLFTFVKVICTFMIALIGFSLVFYVLLKHQGNFSSFLFSLGKIHVMMIGELDFTDVLVENIVNNATVPGTDVLYVPLPNLTIGLFFVFALMVSVVLVNLLVGLAVGDIESTQRTASLRALIEQTMLVESFMKSYPKFILRRVHTSVYEIKPNRDTMFKRIALAGSDLTDQNFMDKLLNYRSGTAYSEQDWYMYSHEQIRQERQEETILKLQATVEAQGKILKAMADRLKITEYE